MRPIVAMTMLFALVIALSVRAEFPTTQPYPEIAYARNDRGHPPQQIHVVTVDLHDADVTVRAARGGEDPDGPAGEWQTILLAPSAIATREQFDVVINGDFFEARNTADAEGGASRYAPGIWARALGPAMTDGKSWARPDKPRAALMFDSKNTPSLRELQDVPAEARQVVAGSHILVERGKRVVESESRFSTTRHPRTAAGIADGGKRLVLVVVDGRRAGEAAGMTLSELADLMIELKCESAINLDGGGSTELLMRDPATGSLHVMNKPSDGRERAVANVLGITIRGTRRVAATLPSSDIKGNALRQR